MVLLIFRQFAYLVITAATVIDLAWVGNRCTHTLPCGIIYSALTT